MCTRLWSSHLQLTVAVADKLSSDTVNTHASVMGDPIVNQSICIL